MSADHSPDTRLVATFHNRGAAKKGLDAVVGHGGLETGRATLLCRRDHIADPVPSTHAGGGIGASIAKGALFGLVLGGVLGLVQGVTIGGSLGIENYDIYGPIIGLTVGAAFGLVVGGLHLGYGWMGSTASRERAMNRRCVAVAVDTADAGEVDRLTALLQRSGATDVRQLHGTWAAPRRHPAGATG